MSLSPAAFRLRRLARVVGRATFRGISITAIVQNDIIRLPVGLHLPDGTAVRLEIAHADEPATRGPAGYFERTAGALAGEPMERPAQVDAPAREVW